MINDDHRILVARWRNSFEYIYKVIINRLGGYSMIRRELRMSQKHSENRVPFTLKVTRI